VRTEFPAGYFEYPPSSAIRHACNSFTPAYAQSTPQPEAKSFSNGGADIVVHGFVDKTGHTSELKVLDDTHHEIATEAMKIVASWTFQPAQCNYQPTSEQRDFIVHFQGWQQ
jgi:hypothetical protein